MKFHAQSTEVVGSVQRGGATAQFEMQATLILGQHKFEYESARKLARIVEKTFDSGTADQYFLYFHGVIGHESNMIKPELRRVQLRNEVRLTFKNELDVTIICIAPGPEHERVGISLYMGIIEKIGFVHGHGRRQERFGATLLQVPGVRSKKGDDGFGTNTRTGRSVWPSVVMGFGYARGEISFRLDAVRLPDQLY